MALRFLTRRNQELLPTSRTDVEMQTSIPGPSSQTQHQPNASPRLADATDNLAVPPASHQQEPSNDSARSAGHGREPSGRSVLSNISSRFAAMRERERSDEYAMAINRLHLARHLHDIEAAANAEAAAAAATGASSGSTSKKETIKARRERDEASALVGPSLAHYFGSGSSSSGAVTGASTHPSNATATQATAGGTDGPANTGAVQHSSPAASNPPTTPGPLPETPGGSLRSFTSRARLGSRGRARGASLSGLNTSLSQIDPPTESPSAFLSPLPASPGGTGGGDQLNLEALTEAVAMAEGIDIQVLKQWIDKSLEDAGAVEIDGATEEAAEKAMQVPSYCTTLQSLVNLKRNTIHLMAASTELGVRATSTALPPVGENVPVEDGQSDHPLSSDAAQDSLRIGPTTTPAAVVQESSLRPARSLSTMPTFVQSVTPAGGSLSGKSTHQLHFEYDCSSPNASVQIFLRASRKHGSWQSWIQKREEQGKPANADGAEESLWFTRGPPPHVLGWPVHSSQVRRGFAQPVKASLALQLELYAPPSNPKAAVSSANAAPTSPKDPQSADSTSSKDPQQADAQASSSTSAPVISPDVRGIDHESTQPRTPTLPPIAPDETKEQRTAREKLERETLKLAVVVEALDANGQPYPEPNLQTTYLRLTSLPIRASPASDLALEAPQPSTALPRLWTAHVEGQEAEIGSHRFQLQELYGLSSRPPPIKVEPAAEGAAGTGEDAGVVIDVDNMSNVGSECLICLSSPTNTLLLPCTHGLCLDCSIQLKESVKAQRDAERRRGKVPKKKYNCPMCRRAFTSMLHLKAVNPSASPPDAVPQIHHSRPSSIVKEKVDEVDEEDESQFVVGDDAEESGNSSTIARGPVQAPL